MKYEDIVKEAECELLGTCTELSAWIDNKGYDVDISNLESDLDIERCPECDWWCETGELVDEDCNPCECESCRTSSQEGEGGDG